MFAITLLLIIALVNARVVPLTHENFDEVVNGDKNVFVKFYAPWCGHCQHLAPEYEIVADSFARVKNVVIAEVNADEDKELANRFEIHGYPTLKFFPAGHPDAPEVYQGERSAEALTNWLNEKMGTRVAVKGATNNVKVLTPGTFDQTIGQDGKTVFVKFYAPWCGHCKKLAPDYKKLADVFVEEKNVIIAEVDADKYKDLAHTYGVTGYPTLKLFRNGEIVDYKESRDLASLVAFVNKHAGTARLLDGSLKKSYGRIAEVDEVLEKAEGFSEALQKEVEAILEKTEAQVAESKRIYASILKKIAEKGEKYVQDERARLTKFVEGENIAPLKKGLFRIRLNILDAFNWGVKSEEELWAVCWRAQREWNLWSVTTYMGRNDDC